MIIKAITIISNGPSISVSRSATKNDVTTGRFELKPSSSQSTLHCCFFFFSFQVMISCSHFAFFIWIVTCRYLTLEPTASQHAYPVIAFSPVQSHLTFIFSSWYSGRFLNLTLIAFITGNSEFRTLDWGSMCSNPCESEVTCFRPESNPGPYGLLTFLSAALSTTELWWRMNHRKSFRTLKLTLDPKIQNFDFYYWVFTTARVFHDPTLVYEGVYNRPEPFLMQPEPWRCRRSWPSSGSKNPSSDPNVGF